MPTRPTRRLLLCLALAAAACSEPPAAPASAEPPQAPPCPERWKAREGGGCEPVLASSCGAGTMPVLGQPDCVPVGWTDCPAGFEKAPSGWGCRAVLPPAPCTGASRDALGGQCAPVGDCNAPFPPANATTFVDPRFTTAQLDPNHYRSLHAALLAASGGEVIAVEAGEYVEWNDVDVPVTIVGRCAEKVVLRAPAPENVGLLCTAARVTVSGLRLVGFDTGFAGMAGCDAALSQVVVEDSGTFGVYAQDEARVTVREAAIRGTQGRRDRNGYVGSGVYASGARITAEACAVTSSLDLGLAARSAGELTVSDTVVRELRLNPRRSVATALDLSDGARASVSRTAIVDVDEAGIALRGPGTRLELAQVAVSNVRQAQLDVLGTAVMVLSGAVAVLDRVQLERFEGLGLLTHGPGTSVVVRHATIAEGQRSPLNHWDFGMGVNLLDRSVVKLEASAVVNNLRAGVEVRDAGSALAFLLSLAQGTRPSGDARQTGGWGVLVLDGGAQLSDSAFLDNGPAAIGAALARLDVRRSILRGTRPSPLNPRTSYGLLSSQDTRTWLEEIVSDDNGSAGLVFGQTGAQVVRSWVSRNAVGVHVFEATLAQTDAAPGGDRVVAVDAATQFIGNGTLVGAGEIALPGFPGSKPP